ncbi:MAG: DUF4878 domain-containing protein [Acidobacteriota bacterium]|nr:DUF4878 domain-containing protein [Acidobacteriota bacterium]
MVQTKVMYFRLKIIIFTFIFTFSLFLISCGGERKTSTPFETFVAYTKAIKQKDTTTMKDLLSAASMKMHEQEAKAQNANLDDIIKRETLFSESQTSVKYRNEKIEGDKATLEVQNSFGAWETVPFVKEEGIWKIDKQGFANQMMQEVEQNNQKIDDIINQGKQP